MTTMRTVTLFVLAAAGLVFSEAHAVNTWTGSESSDWFEGLNWSAGHYPAAGEDVVIDSGANILLTNATADLASFTLNGGTLTFSNWTTRLIATNVTLNGGLVTHALCDTNAVLSNTNRVFIEGLNVTVGSGSQIDVSAKGFHGGDNRGSTGQGPGGAGDQSGYGGGGGYGGLGGRGFFFGSTRGAVYGTFADASRPGSGGGGVNGGGHGGGVVVIDASGHVQINGEILANGRNFIATWSGGGSGGGVSIAGHTVGGAGTVSVNGGNGSGNGGGGAGGRIVLAYDADSQAALGRIPLRLNTLGGTGWAALGKGAMGTIYTPDMALFGDVLSWNGYLHLPDDEVQFASGAAVSNGAVGFAAGQTVRVVGDLTLANGGNLYLQADVVPTNTQYGGLLDVSGAVVISGGCAIYPQSHPTNGGSVKLKMGNLTVHPAGAINADGRGYRGGAGSEDGYGPGKGRWASGSDRGSGGGYGGDGGYGVHSYPGYAYGTAATILDPGSGGGSGGVNGTSGNGGGLIWIEASGHVRIDGELRADGGGGRSSNGGGGSGGGIRVVCLTLDGTGTVRANGENGSTVSGGGGGGRIALLYDPAEQPLVSPQPALSISATGGTGYLAGGGLGTLYVPDSTLILKPELSYSAVIHGTTNRLVFAPSLTVSNGAVGFAPGTEVVVVGDLSLVQNGTLHLWSDVTATNTNYGALLDVAGDITIAMNCAIYPWSHPTNGGSVRLTMRNLTIDSGGEINADGRGYRGGLGTETAGFGDGRGYSHLHYGAGGGYGGDGGHHLNNWGGGATYGYSNAPADPGSGGGRAGGGNGGGLVWIDSSGTVEVKGHISAKGGTAALGFGGGGSGGGVRIGCERFTGDGVLDVSGGNGTLHGGGGGGGRIGVWIRVTEQNAAALLTGQWPAKLDRLPEQDFDVSFVKDGGPLPVTRPGYAGSAVVLIQRPPSGTMIFFR